MRSIKAFSGKLELKDDKIETIFEKDVTSFGSGAKIDCQKKYLGRKVYVIVRKN
mgnify:CR=1 FL=1